MATVTSTTIVQHYSIEVWHRDFADVDDYGPVHNVSTVVAAQRHITARTVDVVLEEGAGDLAEWSGIAPATAAAALRLMVLCSHDDKTANVTLAAVSAILPDYVKWRVSPCDPSGRFTDGDEFGAWTEPDDEPVVAFIIYDNDGESITSDHTVHPAVAEQMADRMHADRTDVEWINTPDAGAYSVGRFEHPDAPAGLWVAEFHGYHNHPTECPDLVAASALCGTRDAARLWLADTIAEQMDLDDAQTVRDGYWWTPAE